MFSCSVQYQTEDRLDVGISAFIVAFAVSYLIDDVIPFDLYQLRMFGKRDEMILKLTPYPYMEPDPSITTSAFSPQV